MKILDDKIKAHTLENGIKSFGYRFEDLKKFTIDELVELNDNGLVGDECLSKSRLIRNL